MLYSQSMSTQITITKAEALAAYDNNGAELGRALGITRQAVYAWPPEGPIPQEHALKLRFLLKPEVFNSQNQAANGLAGESVVTNG